MDIKSAWRASIHTCLEWMATKVPLSLLYSLFSALSSLHSPRAALLGCFPGVFCVSRVPHALYRVHIKNNENRDDSRSSKAQLPLYVMTFCRMQTVLCAGAYTRPQTVCAAYTQRGPSAKNWWHAIVLLFMSPTRPAKWGFISHVSRIWEMCPEREKEKEKRERENGCSLKFANRAHKSSGWNFINIYSYSKDCCRLLNWMHKKINK